MVAKGNFIPCLQSRNAPWTAAGHGQSVILRVVSYRVLPGPAGHLGDELHSLLLSEHGEARGRIVPSSQASHLFVTSPEASTSLKSVL